MNLIIQVSNLAKFKIKAKFQSQLKKFNKIVYVFKMIIKMQKILKNFKVNNKL